MPKKSFSVFFHGDKKHQPIGIVLFSLIIVPSTLIYVFNFKESCTSVTEMVFRNGCHYSVTDEDFFAEFPLSSLHIRHSALNIKL